MHREDEIDKSAISYPAIGEGGKTGEWRTLRPVIQRESCAAYRRKRTICQICWVFCPEGVIKRGTPPEIDYDYCKGCGICAEECPLQCIEMVKER